MEALKKTIERVAPEAFTADEWPEQLYRLPRDGAGRPIPRGFYISERSMLTRAGWMARCYRDKICWVCARPLPRNCVFLLDLVGVITRIGLDGPAHEECIRFPLSRTKWPAGVVALWECCKWSQLTLKRKNYTDFEGIQVGPATRCWWMIDGRQATVGEVGIELRRLSDAALAYEYVKIDDRRRGSTDYELDQVRTYIKAAWSVLRREERG